MNNPIANCSSCGACANVCAHGAISMHLDSEGFYRPIIDSAKCVQCGACEKGCPWTRNISNPNVGLKTPKTVAAYALDDNIRINSSSGGIFSVLAEKILEDGGVVVGVAQLDKVHFKHIIVDNKTDLARLRGSKYVQADAGMVYREVRSLLHEGRKVLFSGTPCQVAALYSVLGQKSFENLNTVDIVCHGTPSVKVFEKYIYEIEKMNLAIAEFSQFRDKRMGWRLFSMSSSLKSDSGCFQFSKTLREDKFLNLFLRNLSLNSSCASCHYAKLPRVADITLGDYWNIATVHPEMDDDKGTSVVLLNTSHGESLFHSISEKLRTCDSFLDKAIAGNPCIVRSSIQHPKRAEFFAELDSMPFDGLVQKYCPKSSVCTRMYRYIRHHLGKIKRILFSGSI